MEYQHIRKPWTLGLIKQPHSKMKSELIKHAYNLARIVKTEFNVGYNFEGIQAIEKAINKERDFYERLPEKEKRHYSYKIGSFIGVCMIQNLNGIWEENENGLGIRINTYLAFPIQKTFKFLSQNGIFDSISSFYEISGSLDKNVEKGKWNSENNNPEIV